MTCRPMIAPLLAPLLLALITAAAMAQDVRQYRSGDPVDARDVRAILGQRPALKMRSIRLLGQDGAANAISEPAPASALSLPVQFGFDSAEILPSAHAQLDALAAGIRQLPDTRQVVIEGHTDAIGPESYNDQLSQRRARAVMQYLVAAHRIDPARLRPVGLGQHMPLPGLDANAPDNRRVQFRGE